MLSSRPYNRLDFGLSRSYLNSVDKLTSQHLRFVRYWLGRVFALLVVMPCILADIYQNFGWNCYLQPQRILLYSSTLKKSAAGTATLWCLCTTVHTVSYPGWWWSSSLRWFLGYEAKGKYTVCRKSIRRSCSYDQRVIDTYWLGQRLSSYGSRGKSGSRVFHNLHVYFYCFKSLTFYIRYTDSWVLCYACRYFCVLRSQEKLLA